MCMNALPVCMYLYHMWACYLGRFQNGVRSPGTEVTTGICEPPCGYLEVNLGPVLEQPVFLIAEPSLQPQILFYFIFWLRFLSAISQTQALKPVQIVHSKCLYSQPLYTFLVYLYLPGWLQTKDTPASVYWVWDYWYVSLFQSFCPVSK